MKDKKIPERECLPAPVMGPDGCQDMVHLEHLNEGALLHNLRVRFHKEHIYVCIIVIALFVYICVWCVFFFLELRFFVLRIPVILSREY